MIHAPRESVQTGHAEQTSLSSGSKLIEQTLLAVEFPFERYMVYWGKTCRSEIIGGEGGGGGGGRLLFCKIV